MFTQGHRKARTYAVFVLESCMKQLYVKEMTVKKYCRVNMDCLSICSFCLDNLAVDLDEVQCVAATCWFVNLPQPVGSLKFMLDLFFTREITLLTRFYKICIIQCPDTCEPICFKLGMMLNINKLYSLPV